MEYDLAFETRLSKLHPSEMPGLKQQYLHLARRDKKMIISTHANLPAIYIFFFPSKTLNKVLKTHWMLPAPSFNKMKGYTGPRDGFEFEMLMHIRNHSHGHTCTALTNKSPPLDGRLIKQYIQWPNLDDSYFDQKETKTRHQSPTKVEKGGKFKTSLTYIVNDTIANTLPRISLFSLWLGRIHWLKVAPLLYSKGKRHPSGKKN